MDDKVVGEKKKINKTLIIVSIVLVIVLIGGVILGVKYYMDSTNITNNDYIDDEEDREEPTTFNEEELSKYLEYIPFGITNTKTVPYYNKSITINEVDKTLLVNMALEGNYEFVKCSNASNCLPKEVTSKHYVPYAICHEDKTCDPKGYDFYPLDKVNTSLKKMYNLDYKDLSIPLNTTFEYTGSEIMAYDKGFLSRQTSGITKRIVHTIDRYEINGDELVIYDYPVAGADNYVYDGYYGYSEVRDFQNNLVIDYEKIDSETSKQSEEVKDKKISNYVYNHKEDFTLFKFTFKKNDTGYYWYSSEVLSEIKEEISLTEKELETYLDYIPFGTYDHDTLPYYNKISTTDSIVKTILVSMALSGTHEYIYCEDADNCLSEEAINEGYDGYVECYNSTCNPKGYDFFPLNKVNVNLHKMYNVNFSNLGIKEYDTWRFTGGEIMYYNDGFLSREASGWYDYVIHAIDRYEEKNNELIIYDYAINGRSMGGEPIDFQNGNIADVEWNVTTIEEYKKDVSKYVLQHKREYTEFKHTFKKNDTGYYWYSTEVVS